MAYLLRLWQVKSEEGTVWRASLESAKGGERVGFANLGAVFDFLRRRTEEGEMKGEEIACREEGRSSDPGIQRKSTWVLPACASSDSLRRPTQEGEVMGDGIAGGGEGRPADSDAP